MRWVTRTVIVTDSRTPAMAAFVWGVVLVVAVCLLQLPAVRWLGNRVEGDGPAIDDPTADLPAAMDEYDREPGVCPRCGSHNSPEFEYCATCTSPLRRLPDER
jgi:ribosomal protein L40E